MVEELPKIKKAVPVLVTASGEANTYNLMQGGDWLAQILWNGKLSVEQQRLLTAHIARCLE